MILLTLCLAALGCRRASQVVDMTPAQAQWRGIHTFSPGHANVDRFERAVREVLAPMGVNVIVLEVNYGFEFQSHPELRADSAYSGGEEFGVLTRDDAQRIATLCRELDIKLIPQFSSLGHQSWSDTVFPLLTVYPEFNEAPGTDPEYCLSWCPQHPDVNGIVFALMDELIDAFDADAFHVGMDEVFDIASEHCERCRGADPAALYATAVNDIYAHLVGERGVTMLMWGDRLLDAEAVGHSRWEASDNGTAPAIDMIPRDIIICDWHYGERDVYPSVDLFQSKGFRVWPASWKNTDAALALLDYAQSHSTGKVIGHLCTTWYGKDILGALLGDQTEGEHLEEAQKAVNAMRASMNAMTNAGAR
jgi:hypothetical protein